MTGSERSELPTRPSAAAIALKPCPCCFGEAAINTSRTTAYRAAARHSERVAQRTPRSPTVTLASGEAVAIRDSDAITQE